MRIWSLSPKYLDTKGLLAVWRETLLAKHVLEGKTKGYKNHPQLIRFKNSDNPLNFINKYLEYIYLEAKNRNYNFDFSKFEITNINTRILVNRGQVDYEINHLKVKLEKRAPNLLENLPKSKSEIEVVPIFDLVDGDVEEWEIVN